MLLLFTLFENRSDLPTQYLLPSVRTDPTLDVGNSRNHRLVHPKKGILK